MLKKHKVTFADTDAGEILFGEMMKYLYDSMISFKANYVAGGNSTLEFECDLDQHWHLRDLRNKTHEVCY